MDDILYGRALNLSCVFDINGADEIYLVGGWNGYDNGYGRINLGRRRILYVDRESYLVVIKEGIINRIKLEFPSVNLKVSDGDDSEPMIILSDYLKQFGIIVKTVPLKMKEIRYESRNGCFSDYGYFLQDSSWLDCWTYACCLFLLNGQLKIGGKSVRSFNLYHSSWIDTDIWDAMKTEIKCVLQKKVDISEQDFTTVLGKRSIIDIYKYFVVGYYEQSTEYQLHVI